MGVDRKQRRRNPAPPSPHHVAAGGGPQVSFMLPENHAGRAATVRRRSTSARVQSALITYMRTELLSISLRKPSVRFGETIVQLYGKRGLAEERASIRPSRRMRRKLTRRSHLRGNILPTTSKHLEADQFRLYSLIWKRTVGVSDGAGDIRTRWRVELLAGSDGPKRTVLAPTLRLW